MNKRTTKEKITAILIAVATAIVACIGLDLRLPELSLDPSWEQALVEATDQSRVFGRDLIFTYGPLHQIATQQVSSNLFPLVLGRILIGQSWFSASILLGLKRGTTASLAFAVLLAILNSRVSWPQGRSDVILILLAATGALLSMTCRLPNRPELGLLASISSGIALSSLVKLSLLPVATVAITCIATLPILHCLGQRSIKAFASWLILIATPLTALSLTWLAIKAGSTPDQWNYFFGPNLEIISGYTEAMSSEWPRSGQKIQILLYIASFAILIRYISKHIIQEFVQSLPYNHFLRFAGWLIPLSALTIIWWVVAKASFVRHDIHALTAGLSIISWSCLAILLRPIDNKFTLKGAKQSIPLILTFSSGLTIALDAGWQKDDLGFGYIRRIPPTLAQLFTSAGRERLRISRVARLGELKPHSENFFLPTTKAKISADILPWEISDLLSQGFTYNPRPIPQSYSAYTPELQLLNAQHFNRSNHSAPDVVISSLYDIDGRLPGGLDGKSLRQILSNYNFSHRGSRGSLLFMRCEFERTPQCGNPPVHADRSTGTLKWHRTSDQNEWVSSPIPITIKDSFIWLDLDLKPTLFRRVSTLAWKPAHVWLEYRDSNGSPINKLRIVPRATNSLLVYPLDNTKLLRLLDRSPLKPREKEKTSGRATLRVTVNSIPRPFESSSYTVLNETR